MTHEEFMMLPYEQRCKLNICDTCIHQNVCDAYMQINCESYIKGDPENSVVISKEEYEKGIIERENIRKQITELFNDREKIFQRLFEEHKPFNDNDVIVVWQVKEVLNKIAKEFGLEIKE